MSSDDRPTALHLVRRTADERALFGYYAQVSPRTGDDLVTEDEQVLSVISTRHHVHRSKEKLLFVEVVVR